jgi:heptosyltransferase-2
VKRSWSDAVDYSVYLVFRLLEQALAYVPLEATFRFGCLLGQIGYWILPGYRKLALWNLRIAFPEWSREARIQCAKKHFEGLAANLLCGFVLTQRRWTEVARYLDISEFKANLDRINPASSVIWVLNHIGNWELMIFGPQWMGPGIYTVFYQKLRNRFIDAHIREARENEGVQLLDRSEGLGRGASILRNGGVLGILVDQHAGDRGVWTPFFGRLASTTPLAAILARKTGARLLPVRIVNVGLARWRVEVDDFIPTENANTEEITARINRQLEEQIVPDPAAWFWVHDRWKTPSPQFLLRKYKRGVYLPEGAEGLKPFQVLIRSSNWLGDAAMSVPAVRRIKRGRPDARLTILTLSKLSDLWKQVPEVDDVIEIQPKESIFKVACRIAGRFDVAILFPNSPRTGLEVWLARVPRRVGYGRPWRDFFLNQFVPEPTGPRPLEHQVQHYLRIAQRTGADLEETLPPIFVPDPKGTAVGLCPGAEYGPAKRWTQFAEAAAAVNAKFGVHWLIFGTAREKNLGAEIAGQLGAAATDLTGRTSLRDLMEHLRRCCALLTNDTGTMHLAAFLQVPTVAIFGSTEPRLTGPLGNGHRVLRHHVICSPCFLRECPLDFRCMRAVTVEEVVAAVEEVLGAGARMLD